MGINFAGASTGISFGNGSRLICAGVPAITVSFWIEGLVLTGDPGLFDITTPSGGSRFEAQWFTGDNKLRFGGRSADSDSFKYDYSSVGAFSSDLMYICVIIDYVDDSISLYIDGVLDTYAGSRGFSQTTSSNTAPLYADIGCNDHYAGDSTALYMNMQVYNKALTPSEIMTKFASQGRDDIIGDLELWIKANEASSGTAITTSLIKDYSPNKWSCLGVSGATKNYAEDLITVP